MAPATAHNHSVRPRLCSFSTRNGTDFSREAGNVVGIQTRRFSGYANRAVDVSVKDNAVVVSYKKSSAPHGVANGKVTATIKGNARKQLLSTGKLAKAARRPDLVRATRAKASALLHVHDRKVKKRGRRVALAKRVQAQKNAKAKALRVKKLAQKSRPKTAKK